MELSLKDIISILLSKIWAIISSVIISALIGFIISSYILSPTYQSRLSLYVFNADTSYKETSLNDLTMAQRLVNSYIAVLQSDKFLNSVINDTNLNIEAKELKKQLKMSPITDTELFEITVSAPSPSLAFKIANSITKLAPKGVERIVKTGRTEVVDTPILPDKPSSPNIMLNTFIGAILGLIISSMIILLMDMLNLKIKSIEEIKTQYSIPILGSISLDKETKRNVKSKTKNSH